MLVSEVMLQQTPVSRVLPVYDEWLGRWPRPQDLAADSPGDAIRAWGSLGYPRRALRLHTAATAITVDHGGQVPGDVETLLTLPGVGDYTARAVAAFAFDVRTPVVDTNVRRVLSRAVRGIDDPGPATAADRNQLEQLLPAEPVAAARFSAAVMELGALICTAAGPDCESCPLAERCAWLKAGRPVAGERPRSQAWHGTDRQVRGRILARLREQPAAVPEAELATLWNDENQWRRCLDSLYTDGLAVRVSRRSGAAAALPS